MGFRDRQGEPSCSQAAHDIPVPVTALPIRDLPAPQSCTLHCNLSLYSILPCYWPLKFFIVPFTMHVICPSVESTSWSSVAIPSPLWDAPCGAHIVPREMHLLVHILCPSQGESAAWLHLSSTAFASTYLVTWLLSYLPSNLTTPIVNMYYFSRRVFLSQKATLLVIPVSCNPCIGSCNI